MPEEFTCAVLQVSLSGFKFGGTFSCLLGLTPQPDSYVLAEKPSANGGKEAEAEM